MKSIATWLMFIVIVVLGLGSFSRYFNKTGFDMFTFFENTNRSSGTLLFVLTVVGGALWTMGRKKRDD